jgi:hypothetical protein
VIDMGRPKTQSKRKRGGHRVKILKDHEGKELVSVQGHTGADVPPGKALQIMQAHVAGMPSVRIARAYNTSYHTVIALLRNRPELLAKAQSMATDDSRARLAQEKANAPARLLCPPAERDEFCGPITRDFLAEIFGYLRSADFSAQHSGIYFMFRGSKCVYVGQSKCVAARCGQHLCGGSDSPKAFDRVMYAPVAAEVMNDAERAAICILNPEYNRTRHLVDVAA